MAAAVPRPDPLAGSATTAIGASPRRFLLAAFGDAGHAFPMIALGRALVARGHEVCMETWPRWSAAVENSGMTYAAAPEYTVFPGPEGAQNPYAAVAGAARMSRELVAAWRPEACVHDILTLAPALAAEAEGIPVATLVPHLHPESADGFPPYALGARLPRTRSGAMLWRRVEPAAARALEQGRRQLNSSRAELGLPPRPYPHNGLSRELTLVATLPQLEYPRAWPPWTRLTGPLLWEPPSAPVDPPPGSGPVVLVAPSTAQDPQHALLTAALAGLAGEPVRIVAVCGDPGQRARMRVPDNAVLVPWLSYAETMPSCDLVISHGGHGTLARALTSGCPVVVCPAGGDMGENAARTDWAGLGVRLPQRLLGPRCLRLAVTRALGDARLRARAGEVATWSATHDAGSVASAELERWLARRSGTARAAT